MSKIKLPEINYDLIIDSDEEYRHDCNFICDNLLGHSDPASKRIVLEYLGKFLVWSRTVEDPKAKSDLEKKIGSLIK